MQSRCRAHHRRQLNGQVEALAHGVNQLRNLRTAAHEHHRLDVGVGVGEVVEVHDLVDLESQAIVDGRDLGRVQHAVEIGELVGGCGVTVHIGELGDGLVDLDAAKVDRTQRLELDAVEQQHGRAGVADVDENGGVVGEDGVGLVIVAQQARVRHGCRHDDAQAETRLAQNLLALVHQRQTAGRGEKLHLDDLVGGLSRVRVGLIDDLVHRVVKDPFLGVAVDEVAELIR